MQPVGFFGRDVELPNDAVGPADVSAAYGFLRICRRI